MFRERKVGPIINKSKQKSIISGTRLCGVEKRTRPLSGAARHLLIKMFHCIGIVYDSIVYD